jgi:protein-S-isoprenylcysteine O-methyltransferase Ste14
MFNEVYSLRIEQNGERSKNFSGFYHYMRNPIMFSVFLILFGEVLLFESSGLILYLIVLFILLHIRTILIEEPVLKNRFGKPYEEYVQTTPRWIPSFKAIKKGNYQARN